MRLNYLFLFLTALLFSCTENLDDRIGMSQSKVEKNSSNTTHIDTIKQKIKLSHSNTFNLDSITFQSAEDYTPISFLKEVVLKSDGYTEIVILNNFPEDWVKESDVANLMLLIESTERCACYLNPLSSNIPNRNADLGGYAILLINSFRNHQKIDLGLWSCPSTNKKKVEELRKWWKKYLRIKNEKL